MTEPLGLRKSKVTKHFQPEALHLYVNERVSPLASKIR